MWAKPPRAPIWPEPRFACRFSLRGSPPARYARLRGTAQREALPYPYGTEGISQHERTPRNHIQRTYKVTGKVYAPDYAAPTPDNLTTAIGDMQRAYTDAAGRTIPDFTELGGGQIGGLTLVPGLYKWGTDVLISSDVTLSGGPNDVWIFQIAGKITQANGTKVFLAGGALAKNVFWQSFGVVSLGTTTHFEGIILAQTAIRLGTGASINGRLLAQTAVTLDSSTVTTPAAAAAASTLVSAAVVRGPYADAIGQSLNPTTKTITAPWSGSTQFYRIRSGTALTITSIAISGGNVVITYN